MEPRLSLNAVTVEFPIIGAATRSLKKAVVSSATGGKFARSGRTQTVKAVNDVTLDLKPGTRLGLVGHNGAGKSTLLKAMAGIYPPTRGQIRIQGRVAPLFGLEAGMDPEATGYENIWLRGLLTGMSVAEIRDRIDGIADFSGLGKYLHMPIRTYSSGMRLRLSFSIATCQVPEILLLDEWLGAGDAQFSKQAEERMRHLVSNASVLVLASHNFRTIKTWCTEWVQVDAGHVSDLRPTDTLSA